MSLHSTYISPYLRSPLWICFGEANEFALPLAGFEILWIAKVKQDRGGLFVIVHFTYLKIYFTYLKVIYFNCIKVIYFPRGKASE